MGLQRALDLHRADFTILVGKPRPADIFSLQGGKRSLRVNFTGNVPEADFTVLSHRVEIALEIGCGYFAESVGCLDRGLAGDGNLHLDSTLAFERVLGNTTFSARRGPIWECWQMMDWAIRLASSWLPARTVRFQVHCPGLLLIPWMSTEPNWFSTSSCRVSIGISAESVMLVEAVRSLPEKPEIRADQSDAPALKVLAARMLVTNVFMIKFSFFTPVKTPSPRLHLLYH